MPKLKKTTAAVKLAQVKPARQTVYLAEGASAVTAPTLARIARTSEQTAVLIAALFYRSKQTRARISEAVVKALSERTRLTIAYTHRLQAILDRDYSLILVELDTGGFGVISAKALGGAKPITTKLLTEDELRSGLTWAQDEVKQFRVVD